MLSELFTFRKQQLEPQTDPQEGLSRLNRGLDGLDQSILPQIYHAITERPDARQNHMTGVLNGGCIARDNRLVSYCLKGLGDTTKIPHSVIDNCDHAVPT